jgi:hypothetical protein
MDIGEIYCLTSPSNKKYVGQCVKLLSSSKKWGYLNRWKEHIRDAKNGKDYCRWFDKDGRNTRTYNAPCSRSQANMGQNKKKK